MKKHPDKRDEVSYSLLENGLDFIAQGVEQIAGAKSKRDLKYGVLNLEAGVELVLKERLRLEDWKLIFANPKRVDERLYASGQFKSVDLGQCLDRLEEHTEVEINDADRKTLEAYYDRRNRIQHFEFNESKEAIESATAEVLSVLLDFMGTEFKPDDLDKFERNLIEIIRGGLQDFRQFTEKRMRDIGPKLEVLRKEHVTLLQCPSCLQHTLHPDAEAECLFCGYADDAEEAADLFIGNVLGITEHSAMKDGEDYPHFWCPDCVNKAMVDKDMGSFICFACGAEYEPGILKVCPNCAEPKDVDGFVGDRCSDCDEAYIQQDHT